MENQVFYTCIKDWKSWRKKTKQKKLSIDLGKQVPGNICTEKQTHGAQKRIQNLVSEMDLQHKKVIFIAHPFYHLSGT